MLFITDKLQVNQLSPVLALTLYVNNKQQQQQTQQQQTQQQQEDTTQQQPQQVCLKA